MIVLMLNIDEGLGSRWRPVCSIANDLPDSGVHLMLLLVCKKTETFQRSMAVPMSIRIFHYSRRTHVWYGRVKQRRLLSIAGLWIKRDEQTTTYARTKKWNRKKWYADASSQTTAMLPCPHTMSVVFHLLPFGVFVGCVRWCTTYERVCVPTVRMLCRERKTRKKQIMCCEYPFCIQMVAQHNDTTRWLSLTLVRFVRLLLYIPHISCWVLRSRALVFVRIAFVFRCSKRTQHNIGVFDTWPPPLENSTQHTILLSFQSVTTENT